MKTFLHFLEKRSIYFAEPAPEVGPTEQFRNRPDAKWYFEAQQQTREAEAYLKDKIGRGIDQQPASELANKMRNWRKIENASQVMYLQAALHKTGYNPGRIDGLFVDKEDGKGVDLINVNIVPVNERKEYVEQEGTETQKAVLQFQIDNPPLTQDGIAGPQTLEKLVEKLDAQAREESAPTPTPTPPEEPSTTVTPSPEASEIEFSPPIVLPKEGMNKKDNLTEKQDLNSRIDDFEIPRFHGNAGKEREFRESKNLEIANQMGSYEYDLEDEGIDGFGGAEGNRGSINRLAEEVVRIYMEEGVTPPRDISEVFGDRQGTDIDFDVDEYNDDGSPQAGNQEILNQVRAKAQQKAQKLKEMKAQRELLRFEGYEPIGYLETQGNIRFSTEGEKAYLHYKDTDGNSQKLEIQSYSQNDENKNLYSIRILGETINIGVKGNKLEFRNQYYGDYYNQTESISIIDGKLVVLTPQIVNPRENEIAESYFGSLQRRLEVVRDNRYFEENGDDGWVFENGNWKKTEDAYTGPTSRLSPDANKRIAEILADTIGSHFTWGDKLYILWEVATKGTEEFLNTTGEVYFQRAKKELESIFTTPQQKRQLVVAIDHVLESSRTVDFDAELKNDGTFKNDEHENNWNGVQKFLYRREKQLPGFTEWAKKKLQEYKQELQ